MKLSKGGIIYGLVLLCVFGAFGAVYMFYFKEKLAKYKADLDFKEELQTAFDKIEQTFHGTVPELLTQRWSQEVLPWRATVEDRAEFFNLSTFREHPKHPEDGPLLPFWYDEVLKEMLWKELRNYISLHMPGGCFPRNAQEQFGVPPYEDINLTTFTEKEAYRYLAQLAFGINVSKLLIDAKPSCIRQVIPWPVRQVKEYGQGLNFRTVGIDMSIGMEGLVELLAELRTDARYWSVDGMLITYKYLGYPQEPQLDVKMLLTQAAYAAPKKGGGAAPAVAGSGQPRKAQERFRQMKQRRPGSSSSRPAAEPKEEPGALGRFWKWFKRTVFVTN